MTVLLVRHVLVLDLLAGIAFVSIGIWIFFRPLLISYRIGEESIQIRLARRFLLREIAFQRVSESWVCDPFDSGRILRVASPFSIRVLLDRFRPAKLLVLRTENPVRFWIVSPRDPQLVKERIEAGKRAP